MNGGWMGDLWFGAGNGSVRGEHFIALGFYHSHFPRPCSPLISLSSLLGVSYLKVICVCVFSPLLDSGWGEVLVFFESPMYLWHYPAHYSTQMFNK